MGYHAPILSLLEGIVARGDERAGLLVLDAYRRGARLDAWEEHVRLDIWRKAIEEAGWDVLGETCRERGRDEKLPWEGVALGMSSSEIADVPPTFASPATPAAAPSPAAPAPAISLPSPAARTFQRVIFSFTKTGAAAFISHLDLMAVFERALLRAGYAARFTEGFNPKPRLEFANPLSLGLESAEEIAGVDLHDYDSEEAFIDRMNKGLPQGLRVTRAAVAPHDGVSRRRSLMSLYWGGDFEVAGESSATRTLRLPSDGLSIRKTLESEGAWATARARRLATWASAQSGKPVSYFDVLGSTGPGSSPVLT